MGLIAAAEDMPIWPSTSFWVSSVPCIVNYDISICVSRQDVRSKFCQQLMHWRNGLWSHNQTISEAWPAEGKVPDTQCSHQSNPQLITYPASAHHSPCLVTCALRHADVSYTTHVCSPWFCCDVFCPLPAVFHCLWWPRHHRSLAAARTKSWLNKYNTIHSDQIQNVVSCSLRFFLRLNKDPPQYTCVICACIFGKSYSNRYCLAGR